MKAQLKAWLNAHVGREPSFREACRIAGWDRRQVLRGLRMADTAARRLNGKLKRQTGGAGK